MTIGENLRIRDIPDKVLNQLSAARKQAILGEHNFVPTCCWLSVLQTIVTSTQDKAPVSGLPSAVNTKEQRKRTREEVGLPPSQEKESDTSQQEDIERLWREREAQQVKSATKADDAAMTLYLWNERVTGLTLNVEIANPLDVTGKFALWWWLRSVLKVFFLRFQTKYKILSPRTLRVNMILTHKKACKDWEAGRECIQKCANVSWWEWDAGSQPLHWQWKSEYQEIIQDALPLWFSSRPPSCKFPQQANQTPSCGK